MKPKTMILMVVAIGCGLVASYMTSKVIGDNKNQAPPEVKVTVLAAKQKPAPWTSIKDPTKYFEVKEVPENAAPKRPVMDLEKTKNQILGKSLSEGAFLSEDDLLSKDQGELAFQMRPGDRATAVRVSPVSLAGGFVLPGSRVDVLATSRGQDPSTTTILQNMLVLAVDTKMVRDETHSMLGSTATLSASPEECQLLTLAENTCELKLNLRPVTDSKETKLRPTRFVDLGRARQTANEGEGRDDKEKAAPAPVPSVEVAKAPPKVAEPKVPVVQPAPKPAPPREVKVLPTHVVKIVNGRNLQKLVYEYDDEEKEWVLGGVQRKQEEPKAEEAPANKDAQPADDK